tara:strand:+ start:1416 stop:1739 length:324 start_codon:yes stop_codon:yes gene_type:complete
MNNNTIERKKYYTISEVSELCDIKSHTLRFWEKEFKALKPLTRAGNRRYYQIQDIDLIKRIKVLLYEEGMTISGAKKNIMPSFKQERNADSSEQIVKDLEKLLKKIK